MTDDPGTVEVDVAVVGGGSAGSTAAIASARAGASTLLIDALPFLGGTSTAVLDTFYGFFTPGTRSRKVVGGIADEVVAGLRESRPGHRAPEHLRRRDRGHLPRRAPQGRLGAARPGRRRPGPAPRDGRRRDGPRRARRDADGRHAGRPPQVRARVVVDASGDADLCHHAGFGYELAGSEAPAQTATTTFRMANVDPGRDAGRSTRTGSTR